MTTTVRMPEPEIGKLPSPMLDRVTRQNLLIESIFSSLNGLFLGLTLMAGPVIALTGPKVSPFELTVLVTAFPIGASLGPFWAYLGRRWGMKELVVRCGVAANLFLVLVFFTQSTILFTAFLTLALLLLAPIRLGQSTLYGVLYPPAIRGRALGRFMFWTFLTMVPGILLAGEWIERDRQAYRSIYLIVGLCGLVAFFCYQRIRLPPSVPLPRPRLSFRNGIRKVDEVFRQNRAFLLFQIAFFLSGSAFFMSTHVVLLLVKKRFALEPSELALWMTVVPQLLIAIGSPIWGRILDCFGIASCRLLIAIILTVYLLCYLLGVTTGLLVLIFLGSVLQGATNGGGQMTWYLGSSHYAPTPEEVPIYHGIHLFLNGARGLLMPWMGMGLYLLIGPSAVLVAVVISFLAVPVSLRLIKLNQPEPGTD